jgi:mannose/fructose/N-acetylgalactosamine-specific phosphotransferase system component IID
MGRLRGVDLWRIGARASLLQATWNYERQQGVGWAWSLQPAIERLVDDPRERSARLVAHTAYFNTQPTLASLALGVAARMEEEGIAAGRPDDDGMRRVKTVLGSSLASLGDGLFWFALRPVAALVGIVFAHAGAWQGALALWLSYNVVHQTVRFGGVSWGYREGPAVWGGKLRARLETLRRFLIVGGAALVGVVVAVLLAPGGQPRPLVFQLLLSLGLGFGLIVAQRPRPTPTELALGVGALSVAATWFI